MSCEAYPYPLPLLYRPSANSGWYINFRFGILISSSEMSLLWRDLHTARVSLTNSTVGMILISDSFFNVVILYVIF